jgi:hypothetical protein
MRSVHRKAFQYSGFFVVIFFWLIQPVMAHHGKDFVATATSELPKRGTLWFLASGDFRAMEQLNNANSDFELSPGLLYGLTSWSAVELHPHIGKESGQNWSYEATGLELRLNALDRPKMPIKVGFAMEYEMASHFESHDAIDARLILSHERGRFNVTGNVGWHKELNGGDATFATLLGVRYTVNTVHSLALEVLSFSGEKNAIDVVPTWTIQLGHGQTLRVGPGVSLNDERPSLSLRTVYVFGLYKET